MNKVFLTGRLTRDPEMRSLASGKNVTTFTVATNEFIGQSAVWRQRQSVTMIRTDVLSLVAGIVQPLPRKFVQAWISHVPAGRR